MVVATLLSGRRVTLHPEVGATAREVITKMTSDELFASTYTGGWIRVGAIAMLEETGCSTAEESLS